jgi:hypothetical protein
MCERIGLFQTTTNAGRVRWRGVLQDPSELALTTGIVLPFAFASFEQKRSAMVYVTLKVSFTAMRRYTGDTPQALQIRAWAMALLSGFAGMMVGIFFLSFTYHYVLWIYFGLSAAYYCAIRGTDPTFKVSLGWRDLGRILLADVALVIAIFAYTKNAGF